MCVFLASGENVTRGIGARGYAVRIVYHNRKSLSPSEESGLLGLLGGLTCTLGSLSGKPRAFISLAASLRAAEMGLGATRVRSHPLHGTRGIAGRERPVSTHGCCEGSIPLSISDLGLRSAMPDTDIRCVY